MKLVGNPGQKWVVDHLGSIMKVKVLVRPVSGKMGTDSFEVTVDLNVVPILSTSCLSSALLSFLSSLLLGHTPSSISMYPSLRTGPVYCPPADFCSSKSRVLLLGKGSFR